MENNRFKKLDSLTRGLGIFSGRLVVIIVIIVTFYLGATMAYRFGYSVFRGSTPDPAPGKDIEVTITEDMSGDDVAKLLEDKGIVSSDTIFRFQELLYTSKRKPIYPGTYTLNSSWNCDKIFNVITAEPESQEETTALAVSPFPAGEEG